MSAIAVLFGGAAAAAASAESRLAMHALDGAGARPNILIIYTDDVGYGDVSAYGYGEIETPRIDALAKAGRMFTRGHASSSTCTPSRYSLLTGRYPFRNERAQILQGTAPLLIEPGSLTIASHLSEAGYHTSVIGKWHLGLGDGDVDWNEEVKPGPLEIGFDESYLLPATNDRVPTVYLKGHRVENLDPEDPITVSYGRKVGNEPTGRANPDLLRMTADGQHSDTIVNGIGRIGFQTGGKAAMWDDDEMALHFTELAIEHIEEREATDGDRPWFLFFNLHNIHAPRTPHERFLGTSDHGIRGDHMLELDWSVGQLVDTLDRLGITEETLVVFSSDNGPVLHDGYDTGGVQTNGGHLPSGPYRGGKYRLWEGGTRVPFIATWPGTIEPGATDALICQLDLLAITATLAGRPLDDATVRSIDSRDLTPTLLGETDEGRETLITQAVRGLVLHHGDWRYIPADQSRWNGLNDWPYRKHNQEGNPLNTPPPGTEARLSNIANDPSESTNVAPNRPVLVGELDALMKALIADPGADL